METTNDPARVRRHGRRRAVAALTATLGAVLFAGLGCRVPGPSSASQDAFIRGYAALLRAEGQAHGDPSAVREFLAAQSLPDGWREDLLRFAESTPLDAEAWHRLLVEARTRADENPEI
jgi:hypothetical protein